VMDVTSIGPSAGHDPRINPGGLFALSGAQDASNLADADRGLRHLLPWP
jgi:hypothetical protein